MNDDILVSIIIPAYNTEKYIHRAIESSLRQTHKNIELIVIDDGSKDNTLEAAKSYAEKDSRVRVYHKENGGVSSARNMGIREAHGKYITFLDSDDWLEDCAVEVLLEAQINNPDKFVSADLYFVSYDESENVFRRQIYDRKEEARDMTIEQTLAVINDIKFMLLHAKMYVTEAIRKYNIHFRENVHYGEDLLFNFEYICKIRKVFYLSKPVLNFLSRSDSAMHVSYEQRRIFIDGKLNDFLQTMVEYPDNTPEMTRLMKVHHTRRWVYELYIAFRREGNYGGIKEKINQVREAARMYTREYLKADTVSLRDKLIFIVRAYLPASFSKIVDVLFPFIQNLLGRNKKLDEEIIPYW